MRGTARRIAAAFFASFGFACSTSPDIALDERADFSDYRTWDWLTTGARTLGQPIPIARLVNAHLTRIVEDEMQALGLEHGGEGPDLLVSCYLKIDREVVEIRVTPAMQHLSSLHFSPSYSVQTSRLELHTFETGTLVIAVVDRRQQNVVWRARSNDRHRGGFAPHLGDAVSSLFERFPQPETGELR
jgi:hypothetical protein